MPHIIGRAVHRYQGPPPASTSALSIAFTRARTENEFGDSQDALHRPRHLHRLRPLRLETECPVKAIFTEDDVPAEWKHYIQLNAEHYKK